MTGAPERVVVGRIVRPHGLRGELVVEVLSDAPDRFAPGSHLDAGDPVGESIRLTVASTRRDRARLLVTFAEVADRTAAERLHGALLSISSKEVPPPPNGTFYVWQLEGLEVVDESGHRLGVLSGVLERAGNDVWVVATDKGDVMVPAVDEFVSVDQAARRIIVRVIPGLFE